MVKLGIGTDEEWAELRRQDAVITNSAMEIATKLNLDAADVKKALKQIAQDYEYRLLSIGVIEKAAEAKKDLRRLAKKTEELLSVMRGLGQGAVIVMNRRTVRQELISDAEPFNLIDHDPYDYGCVTEVSDPWDQASYEEWRRGGRWIVRLEALAELARVKADRIEEETGKGGRKTFSDRLFGKHDDWLAEACKEFAEAHGCRSQAVCLEMLQAIKEAVGGKRDMEMRESTKRSEHKGRKAVRKMAQTKKV